MNELIKDFDDLQDDFHEVLHTYPIFKEMLDKIYDIDIKEINELLDKNDEFYLKKAIDKLKDINKYIKDTSLLISDLYNEFDKNVRIWDSFKVINASQEIVEKMNDKVRKANNLINSHDIKDLKEANKIMASLIKDARSYR